MAAKACSDATTEWWKPDPGLCSITLHLFLGNNATHPSISISIIYVASNASYTHIWLYIHIYHYIKKYIYICIVIIMFILQRNFKNLPYYYLLEFLGIKPWCQLLSCKLGTACPAPNASRMESAACNEASPPEGKVDITVKNTWNE